MKLEGKVAIVTGAGRGIGRGIALCLAEEGADVAVNSLHEETAKKVAAEIEGLGRKSLTIVADVTESEKVVWVVEETISTFGKIDILVNNVGGAAKKKEVGTGFLDPIEAEWDGSYEQNLRSAVLMCRAVIPHFIKQKSGKIVNISSIAGRYGFPHTHVNASYGTMKAGVIRFSQSLACELGEHNINVNCVCPGVVYTDAFERGASRRIETRPEWKGLTPREWFLGMAEGRFPELGPVMPLRREQTPEDMGRAVVFLVSEDARNITGQALNVDGGFTRD